MNLKRLAYTIYICLYSMLACEDHSSQQFTDTLVQPEVQHLDQSEHDDLIDFDVPNLAPSDATPRVDDFFELEDQETALEPPPWFPPQGSQPGVFKVRILLDLIPTPQVTVSQGGSHQSWITDERGEAWIELDTAAISPLVIFAAHPQARTKGYEVTPDQVDGVTIELKRFRRPDQPRYPYSDPGEPDRRNTTSQCGHCHLDINDGWFASPHRSSAKNPIVYDLYTGRGSGHQNEESCTVAGGHWRLGPTEGGLEDRVQCFFNLSALKVFNPSCDIPCDPNILGEDAYFGSCADCHAPTVNGLNGGGHDLLSVEGRAFDYGISCDFCHHVESVQLDKPAGVGGRLIIQRPRESGPISLGGGGYKPLSFGPHADISNPRMGISPRSHFRDGTLCGGCHQHQHQEAHNAPAINEERWPSKTLPNQSTYEEWLESSLGSSDDQKIVCNSCHMPTLPHVMNSANLEYFTDADIGIQGGWPRPYGETRAHTWWGPRQAIHPILNLSAHLSLGPLEISEDEGQRYLSVQATTSNIGAGHGLPTGEPMRQVLLVVNAECDETPLMAIGGDVIHDIGGALETRNWEASQDPWPKAQVGDRLRVVRPTGLYYDYDGYGAFRDPSLDEIRGVNMVSPSFTAHEKGLEQELAIGEVQIISTDQGDLNLDQRLPGQEGDRVYLITNSIQEPRGYAGHSGFSFARVLTGEQAPPMLPHFAAQDLIRDNRLRPGDSWSTNHHFALPTSCQTPHVNAQLVHRPYPWWLSTERKWAASDRVIRQVSRSMTNSSLISPPQSSRSWAHPEYPHIQLQLPLGLEVETLHNDFNLVTVQLDDETVTQSDRRAEAWLWRTQLHSQTSEDHGENIEIHGPITLLNLSHYPLALETIESAEIYGASLDQSLPPTRALRSSPSQAESLWIIPPQSGVLLLPKELITSQAILAVGYSPQGGRSWSPSRSLFTWHATDNDSEQWSSLPPANLPVISRGTSNSAPPELLGQTHLALTYQGSERVNRWHISHSELTVNQLQTVQPNATLISVRNLSTNGHPFQLINQAHQQWNSLTGWSDLTTTSWIPVAGEILIQTSPLPIGQYTLGAPTHEHLQTTLRIE